MKLPIFNIVLGNSEGLTKMSLVEYPAVESDFLAFEKQEALKFSVDEEQHIVFGCALRADFPIYREDARLGEYYVVFSKDTIKELYEKFMRDEHYKDVNLEHSKNTNGVYLIQSFIKNTNKGINPVGFENVEDGSWFTAYKVENEDVWKEVKDGKFKGFSVEMFGELEPIIEKPEEKDILDEIFEYLK